MCQPDQTREMDRGQKMLDILSSAPSQVRRFRNGSEMKNHVPDPDPTYSTTELEIVEKAITFC
jgi:hypothetical protein